MQAPELPSDKDKLIFAELQQSDIPTFYTYEEGLSHLTAEGQATLERLEGMLAQSISSQYNMAGVRTEDSVREFEGKKCFFFTKKHLKAVALPSGSSMNSRTEEAPCSGRHHTVGVNSSFVFVHNQGL